MDFNNFEMSEMKHRPKVANQDPLADADSPALSTSMPIKEQEEHHYEPHASEGSQYLRDIILGINDGLVSMFLLVFGIVGGGLDSRHVLATGLAGAVAGAMSMALGEYLATKAQADVTRYDIALEKEHFKYYRDQEIEQIRCYLKECNINGPLLEEVIQLVGNNDDALMKLMMAFEFGVEDEDGARNPLISMAFSGCLFLAGSIPSVIPFTFCPNPGTGLIVAGCLACLSLFVVGALKTKTTKGNPYRDGLENVFFGVLGAACSYGVGAGYNAIRTIV